MATSDTGASSAARRGRGQRMPPEVGAGRGAEGRDAQAVARGREVCDLDGELGEGGLGCARAALQRAQLGHGRQPRGLRERVPGGRPVALHGAGQFVAAERQDERVEADPRGDRGEQADQDGRERADGSGSGEEPGSYLGGPPFCGWVTLPTSTVTSSFPVTTTVWLVCARSRGCATSR